jgi:Protein tyrosine and serine/threonine kinase
VSSFRNINWSSPEVLNGKSTINQSADVWSLAFVITEIFTGDVPFDTEECRLMSLDLFKDMLEKGLRPAIPENLVSKNPWIREMVSGIKLFV